MHRVRLYPTSTQAARLDFMLDVTREIYNALLEQRRYVWTSRRIAVTHEQQCAEITAPVSLPACQGRGFTTGTCPDISCPG